jgi:uncharacterized protein (DUF305 family)
MTLADRRLHRWVALALLSLIVLITACSDGGESADPGSVEPTFNQADVKFAQTMIPHHEQAIEMADAVLAKPEVRPEIAQLAQQIKDVQVPQVETLTGFLAAWEQPLIPDHSSEADEDHWDAEGVLTPEEMQALFAADTAKGQQLFLRGMLEHHEGAVEMVQDEINNGQNPDAVQLAQAIKDGQTAEITTMRALLADL